MIMVQILMVMLVALTKDDDDADNVGQCWSIIVIKLNPMNKQRVTNPSEGLRERLGLCSNASK